MKQDANRTLWDRLVADGVVPPAPTPVEAALATVATPQVVVRPGHSHVLPEDLFDELVRLGRLPAPVISAFPSSSVHPDDLVEWAIAYWWPGYARRFGIDADADTLEHGVGELATVLSIATPETTPKMAADKVRAYVHEAAVALLAGDEPPRQEGEKENRLQILRGITNQAARVAYSTLVSGRPIPVKPQPEPAVDGESRTDVVPSDASE